MIWRGFLSWVGLVVEPALDGVGGAAGEFGDVSDGAACILGCFDGCDEFCAARFVFACGCLEAAAFGCWCDTSGSYHAMTILTRQSYT